MTVYGQYMGQFLLVLPRSGHISLVMHRDIVSTAKLWSFIPGYDLIMANFARYDQDMPNHAKVWPIHA